MFKKRVQLFGKSVPVAVVLALVSVLVVFAGWYVNNYYGDITFSSGDSVAPDIAWQKAPLCSVTGGGTVSVTELDAEGFNVGGSGLMPNSQINCEYYPKSTDAGGILWEVDLSGTPDWIASASEDCDGLIFTNTMGYETCNLTINVVGEAELPIATALDAYQIVFSASLGY